jgi:hypothetical protein
MLWYPEKQFGDYSLRLQFRDDAPGDARANSGVFTRFPDPRTPLADRPECGQTGSARTSTPWIAIYCGHEIQIYDGATGEAQKTGSVYNFDSVDTLQQAGATPKGEWNDYEIRAVGQHFTMIRNGVVINEFDNTPGKQSSRAGDPPTALRQFLEGYIGLQNHGNSDIIEMRNIKIKYLASSFDAISDSMDIYLSLDRLAGHVSTSLKDRLTRAKDAAAAGSEVRTIGFLEQFIARAKNQVKGDADDIEVRNQLVALAQELIAKYQAMDDAENAAK